jgi:hypothetical protein
MPSTSTEDRILRTVDAQTSPAQPDTVRPGTIVLTLAGNGSMNPGDVRQGMQSAVDAGRLEHTEEGRLRVADGVDVPVPGKPA